MFVIELVYTADLAQIDAHMKEHMTYVRRHYEAGTFIMSGRKVPRDGGILLAIGTDRAQVEQLVRQDPFVVHGVANYRIIQFNVSQRADDIPKRIE
jgi:uncharacterized protein YciI